MKKIHLGMPKRPDVKGTVHKLKNLKKEDVINWRRDEPIITHFSRAAGVCNQPWD